MRATSILSVLSSLSVALAQLNYEGNPLTEDTVYMAEESHFTEKKANARSLDNPETETAYIYASKNDLFKVDVAKNEIHTTTQKPNNYENPGPVFTVGAIEVPIESSFNYQSQGTEYDKKIADAYNSQMSVTQAPLAAQYRVPDASQSALSSFMNSRTPAESQMALDAYLNGQKVSQERVVAQQSNPPRITDIVLPTPQQQSYDPQSTSARSSEYAQQVYPDYAMQPVPAYSPVPKRVNNLAMSPYYNRYPLPRPYFGQNAFTQPRILAPGLNRRKSGSFVPYNSLDGPEIVFAKPMGVSKSHGPEAKVPYQILGGWYPDGNRPPPAGPPIYASQLYAQSYDPHYYNYIAKYGKIRPDLYGKLGEQKDHGIMWELFENFKKHGIKHITHPMFVMGFGIPVITLMLSALIQKRALGRSASGGYGPNITEEQLDQYINILKRALECYRSGQQKC